MKINFSLLIICFSTLLNSCMKAKHADLIIHNARIHTMNENNNIENAIAIKDGKIIEVGPERQILNKYSSDETIDAGGKDVYPSFTDGRSNLLAYANQKLNLELTGTASIDELIVRIEKYSQRNQKKIIVGYGLDLSFWNKDESINIERLNSSFPKLPICIYSKDGSKVVVNQKMSQLIKSKLSIQVESGIVNLNSIALIEKLFTKPNNKELTQAILEIQDELFQYGITNINEANLSFENISYIKQLIASNKLKLNIYGMLAPSEANFTFAKKHPKFQYKDFSIRSFDVAIENSDATQNLNNEELKRIALVCELSGYQLRATIYSAISLKKVTPYISTLNEFNKDHRSTFERLAYISKKDLSQLSELGIYPSLLPSELKNLTDYKSLLTSTTMINFGSNFPFSSIDPFFTIHNLTNGISNKNSLNKHNELLSIDESIKGMTIWAAYSRFQETSKGSLEKGKDADLVIFEHPVNYSPIYNSHFAYMTFIKGEKVFSVE